MFAGGEEKSEKVEQSKYQSAGSETKADGSKKEEDKKEDKKDNIEEVVEGDRKKQKTIDDKDNKKKLDNEAKNQQLKKDELNSNTKDESNIQNKKEDKKDATKAVKKENKNNNESVSVDIEGGIQSEEIANRLKRAGVIADSEAFNKFMIEHGYDSNMRTGTFLFHKNMNFTDIRNILIKEEYR